MQEVTIGIGLIVLVFLIGAVSFVAGVVYHLSVLARQPGRGRSNEAVRRAAAKWARARRNSIERGVPTWEDIEAGLEDYDGREVCDPQEHATEEDYKNCPICRGGAS